MVFLSPPSQNAITNVTAGPNYLFGFIHVVNSCQQEKIYLTLQLNRCLEKACHKDFTMSTHCKQFECFHLNMLETRKHTKIRYTQK